MSGRTRGRPRIEHPDAPSQEMAEEQQHPSQFATIEQVTILQNQMSTIMEMLQRMTAPPHTSEAPPSVEPPATEPQPDIEVPPAAKILPNETMQTHEIRRSLSLSVELVFTPKFSVSIKGPESRFLAQQRKDAPGNHAFLPSWALESGKGFKYRHFSNPFH
ncbi:Uncharacterized protein Fot_42387 [Forsythia ovata]|uniref:Uncharacterized protein n=1 Tax=Forsythia ovata TaxID=205694 RepID=A0ABD1RL03_9LAMI